MVLVLYGGLLGLTYWSFTQRPRASSRRRTRDICCVNVQLPDSSSLERTQEVMKQIEQTAGKMPGVAHTVAIAGQSILLNANAPNFGAMYVMLDEFHHRATHGLSRRRHRRPASGGAAKADRRGDDQRLQAPPVDGLGTAGGFKIVVEDRGDLGLETLQDVANGSSIARRAATARACAGLFTSFRANTPWLNLDIDRTKARLLGVSIAELFNTCRCTWARSTSTTSTCSAGPGRSTSRARPISASRSTIWRSSRFATSGEAWCRSAAWRKSRTSAGR